jgi:hypothetical protein
MNCHITPLKARQPNRSSIVVKVSDTFGDRQMKKYILVISTLLAAAGSASANNDYVGCDARNLKNHSERYYSSYCGNLHHLESRRDSERNDPDDRSKSFGGKSYN